jgi:hypothetical protein
MSRRGTRTVYWHNQRDGHSLSISHLISLANLISSAMARKLAVHLYWMWRQGWDYGQLQELGSHAGEAGNRYGGQ